MRVLPFQITHPPASESEIQTLIDSVGPLPTDYLSLLSETNGAELGVHDRDGDCLAIWSVQEVLELNSAYEIQKWLPRLIAIGSDGGDDAIGLLRKDDSPPELWPVVRVGFGALLPDEIRVIAPGFKAWKDSGYDIREN